MKKRILSLLLAFLMLVSISPVFTYAEDGAEPDPIPTEAPTASPCPTCSAIDCDKEHKACDKCGTVDCTADHSNWCEICKVDNCGRAHIAQLDESASGPACNCNAAEGEAHAATCPAYTCPDCGAAGWHESCPDDQEPDETPTEPEVCAECGETPCACEDEGQQSPDYSGDIGKYVVLNRNLSTYTAYVTYEFPYYPEDFTDDTVFTISNWRWDAEKNQLWYQLEFVRGSTQGSFGTWTPGTWILQNGSNGNSLIFVSRCGACGEFNCAKEHKWCEVCEDYDCGKDHTTTEPEAPDLSHPESGIVISGTTFPEDVKVSVSPADVSAAFAKYDIPVSKKVFGLDISLIQDGEDYQPGTSVKVKVPVAAAAGTKIGLIHNHDGAVYFMGVTSVLSDGTVEFYTDRFSEFAGFTVDFHYNGIDYSINGLTSIKLSELFVALEIDRNAAHVIDVTYSDPSQIEVTRIDGDWQLESLKAFDTEETLEITFYDGEIITIKVTDSRVNFDFGSTGVTGHTKDNLVQGTGTKNITVILYDGNTGDELARSTVKKVAADSYVTLNGGEKYWLQVKSIDGGSKLKNKPYGDEDQHHICLTYANTKDVTIHVNCWPSAIPETGSSNFCTIRRLPKVVANSSHTETRNVHVWVKRNGSYVKVEEFNGLTFPDRNGDKNGHDVINADLDLTVSAKKGYTYISKSDDGNRTYNVYLEPTPYTISYMLDGGSASNPTSYNIETATFTLKEPTKTGYTFLGWTGSNGSTPQKTVTIKQGSTGARSYTANWTAKTDATYTVHYYLEGSTTQLQADKVVTGATFGQEYTEPAAAIGGYVLADGQESSKKVTAAYSNNEIAFYYKAVVPQYTVSYSYTGDVPAGAPAAPVDNNRYIAGASVNVAAAPTPAPDGYTFGGWTADGVTVNANGQFTMPDGSVTFKGRWNTVDYIITYDLDGGSLPDGVTSKQQTYKVTQALELMSMPEKEGYKFTGWKLNESVGSWVNDTYEAKQAIAAGQYGNITLVAQWADQYRYELSFDANTTDQVSNMPTPIDTNWIDADEYSFDLPAGPTRDNYDFMGWAASPDATADQVLSKYTMEGNANGTVSGELYAVWQRQTGDLKLRFNGNDSSPAIVTVSGQGLNITLLLTKAETLLKGLPTGSYTITAESGNASYTASVSNSEPQVEKEQTTVVDITIGSKGLSWFTAFFRVKNKCS